MFFNLNYHQFHQYFIHIFISILIFLFQINLGIYHPDFYLVLHTESHQNYEQMQMHYNLY